MTQGTSNIGKTYPLETTLQVGQYRAQDAQGIDIVEVHGEDVVFRWEGTDEPRASKVRKLEEVVEQAGLTLSR